MFFANSIFWPRSFRYEDRLVLPVWSPLWVVARTEVDSWVFLAATTPGPLECELRAHKREQLNDNSFSQFLHGYVAPPLPPGWLDQLWLISWKPGLTWGPSMANTSFAGTVGSGRFVHLRLPYRLVMAGSLLGILACQLRGYLRLRRLRQESSNPCRKCSYNLTGNVSGICPECGTPI